MIQRMGRCLACAAVLAAALGPAVTMAKEETETKAEKVERQVEEQRALTRTLSHKMMGHISLAELALNVGMEEAALDHVRKAGKVAAQLEASEPEVRSVTQYKYGKLSYELDDEDRQYYVPVVDDVFLLSDYRETHHAFSKADVEEVDAGVVEVTISADLREVSSALANAEEKLVGKDGAAARVALAAVFKNAIVDEEVVEDPLWAIHDNLALARNLIENENYDSARMALEHARKRLAALVPAKDSKGEAQPALEELNGEIAQIQADLSKKDPTLRERATSRLSSWMETVGSWYGKAESDSPAS